jgi:hypothetical protein
MYLEHFIDFAELLHSFRCHVVYFFQSGNELYIIIDVKIIRPSFVVVSLWYCRKLLTFPFGFYRTSIQNANLKIMNFGLIMY